MRPPRGRWAGARGLASARASTCAAASRRSPPPIANCEAGVGSLGRPGSVILAGIGVMSTRTAVGYVDLPRLLEARAAWRRDGAVVVFTNGCFDLLHRGHVELLAEAKKQGDVLVVGINSDASMRAIKGPDRPLVAERDRAAVLAALAAVDAVTIFDEPTPARLKAALEPDVLIKGGDWPVDQIVGASAVLARGGRVDSLPLVPGYSTTALIQRLTAGRGRD